MALALVATISVSALTPWMASGDDHLITDEYITVEPDGYWNAQVAAGGHQQWSFELPAPRTQNIRIEDIEPAGSSLEISLDGEDLVIRMGKKWDRVRIG